MSTSFSRSPNLENRAHKILVLSPRQLAEPVKVAGNRLIPRNSLKRYTMFVTSKRTHCPSFFSLFRPRLFAVIRRVCTRAPRLLIFRCVRKTATFPADTPGGLSRFLCSISKYRLLPWPFFFASSFFFPPFPPLTRRLPKRRRLRGDVRSSIDYAQFETRLMSARATGYFRQTTSRQPGRGMKEDG